MSVRLMSWVFDASPTSGNERLVLLVLADEADDDGTNAYPSVERIAHKANIHRATVLRVLVRLEKAGQIRVIRRATRGPGHYNRYVVVPDESYPHTSQNATLSTSHLSSKTPKSRSRQVLLDPKDPKTRGASQRQDGFAAGSGRLEDFTGSAGRRA